MAKMTDPKDDETHSLNAGMNEVLQAAANLIEKDQFVEAVSAWIKAHAPQPNVEEAAKARADKAQLWAMVINSLFGLAIFSGVAFLAWHKVLGAESASTILGALIGYWYGQSKKA